MANIYDKSSLVLIPSGTKTGKIFSQKPVSGDGDFTFTRASAATRVNADGNIEKETQNLLLQSNSFDTTWTLDSGMTLTSGQSGYDGSSDAWLLSKSAASYREMKQSISLSGVNTFSLYAKASTLSNVVFRFISTSGNHYARFNLSTGAVTSTTGDVFETKIEDIGSGWYRCSATANVTATEVYVYPDVESATTAGNILIQDAQVEQGLVARDVITTTTTAVYGGITDNTPRLDYTDSSCPALLLEPQRTNLIPQSEYFADLSYVLNGATIATNSATSPEGYINADNLIENNVATQHRFIKSTSLGGSVDSSAYVISVFVKNLGRNVQLNDSNQSVNGITAFNLQTKSVISGTGKIEDYGNGWLRLSIYPLKDTSTTSNLFFNMINEAGATFYTGDGVSGVSLYGFQAEAGTYATSYIPTYGSSVSRVADSCVKTGVSSLIGQTEGVLFADIELNLAGSNTGFYALQVYDSSFSPTYQKGAYLELYQGKVYGYVRNSGIQCDIVSGIYADGQRLKMALAYKANDFALYVNGIQIGIDTSGSLASALDSVSLHYSASTQQSSPLKQALVFKTRLTNEELAALTTI